MSTSPDADPVRVVLVDDTADLRDLLRFALKRHGFEVVAEAGDGREGIEVVTRLRPDLILLDMAMPVMDGLEALPHMRAACPASKIVVLSGFGATEMTRRAVAAGADGYLQKGAPISRIVQYVREITSLPAETPDASAGAPLVAVPDLPPAPATAPVPGPDHADGGSDGSLEAENEVLRRAIATTAHEIRSPVTVLMGIVESIQASAESLDTERLGRLLSTLDRQTRLLDRITSDLLVSAQARTRHRGDPGRSWCSPGRSSRESWHTVIACASTSRTSRPVLVDPYRLEQMLENLVSNAEKYGAPPLAVRVRGLGDRVCIDVEDSGAGVPLDFRERLFDEFSRAGDAEVPGTGLGLFVVRSLAEAQGGTATYVPGPFGGSVFTLSLPTD